MNVSRPAARGPARGHQRGVGLIEILLSVMLISIGFLATARMQLEGMRFSQSAYFRSQAHFLASEMADRMRANLEGVDDGHYDGRSIGDALSNPGCGAKNCVPAEIARQDLYDWRMSILGTGAAAGVVGALPDGGDQVPTATIEPLGSSDYRITLAWPEVVAGANGTETLSVDFTIQAL